jgi:hypothetical protein
MHENAPVDRPLPCKRVSQLTPRSYDWLWRFRFAFGKLALLDGDAGEGKSLVALDLCARLSNGRPMPDSSAGPGVADSLIIQDEDGAEDTVRHRLQALGADLDRIGIWTPEEDDDAFAIPSRLGLLERMINATGARLVVIDPILAFLDARVFANSEQAIRRAFRPLKQLAERLSCVLLMVRHFVKQQRMRSLYRGLGSVAMTNVCRSTWQVGRDPEHADRRVLAQAKNNLAAPQPSLAYRLVGVEPATTVEWLGESPWTADQLGLTKQASPKLEQATAFLGEFLADGPRTSADVRAAARRHRIAPRTLNRAGKLLGVRTRRLWRDHVLYHYWLLPGQAIPTSAAPDDFDRHLAEIEKERSAPQ